MSNRIYSKRAYFEFQDPAVADQLHAEPFLNLFEFKLKFKDNAGTGLDTINDWDTIVDAPSIQQRTRKLGSEGVSGSHTVYKSDYEYNSAGTDMDIYVNSVFQIPTIDWNTYGATDDEIQFTDTLTDDDVIDMIVIMEGMP